MGPAQKGHLKKLIGRSRGGLTTKINAVVDALGNPLRICLTGGHVHDISPAYGLISGLSADYLLANKAYDAENFISLAQSQGSAIVIPPKDNR